MIAKTIFPNRKNLLLLFAAMIFSSCAGSAAQTMPSQTNTKPIKPSKQQLRQLILDLQVTALKCDQKTLSLARQTFEYVEAFRLKFNRFPTSFAELQRFRNRRVAEESKPIFSLPNPYADETLVSKELRQEMNNSGMTPSKFCKVIIENDPQISASFPLSLNNVRLYPASEEPGSIIVKHNGDAYVAVWCMGFSGKPILDEKTQLPMLFFKDFSMLDY